MVCQGLPPRSFVLPILATHLLFVAIAFAIPFLAGAFPLKATLIIASLLYVFTAPTTVVVTLGMARLSHSHFGPIPFKVACRRGGYIYGVFAGSILGSHYWGTPGAIAAALAFFGGGWLLGNKVGAILWARLQTDPK
ncbi:MAG: hypothetical protein A2Y74_06135 [Actinobacteria bacterium RBG_13_63_9]|nr:MAG: hypothetical protein A2Y74_06135 [Actinobacteria bacterium RBG_13_63_9]